MLTVKWQNLSGNWFQDEYPDPMGHVVFEWKKTGGVTQRVELWGDDGMIAEWKNK